MRESQAAARGSQIVSLRWSWVLQCPQGLRQLDLPRGHESAAPHAWTPILHARVPSILERSPASKRLYTSFDYLESLAKEFAT
ncbi:hypothetical protein NDU88_003460 [Pleurodeles waltl]|uniref:Uncharacterized protein n=1 Tax=Pleurodeles waltl TaxID=8319 RepID=A0AAV7LFE3_PLEWA|nr:hypothetical protein NDU88_003460 [Pleurodeles waltl]